MQACKALVNRVPTWEADAAFDEASTWSVATFQSDEAAEGMAAFREKRHRVGWGVKSELPSATPKKPGTRLPGLVGAKVNERDTVLSR